MTLTALAKLAHVSVSTASKAFTMSKEVNDETRNMIFRIAKEHGCFRNFFKAKYPKLMVGIICYEVKSRYYSIMIESIKSELEKFNCDVCLTFTEFDSQKGEEALQYFEKYTDVDAIIFIGNLPDKNTKYDVPILCFSKKPCENADFTLKLDIESTINEVLQKAQKKNISEIGFIGEALTENKLEYFKKSYENIFHKDCSKNIVKVNERFESGGYIGMKELLSRFNPRLVICAYDDMAFGCMRYAHEIGLKIPEDIEVLGMNNILESKYSIPSLSSIGIDNSYLSQKIVECLINITLGKQNEKFMVLKTDFYERESTMLS